MKFKIGDKVRVVEDVDAEISIFIGALGTVTYVPEYEEDFYEITTEAGEEIEVFEDEIELAE